MRKFFCVLIAGLILSGCEQAMVKEEAATGIAQSAFVDYAKKNSIDVSKYAKPQVMRYDDVGVWQFFYVPSAKDKNTPISVLVVNAKRVQVTPVPDSWIKK